MKSSDYSAAIEYLEYEHNQSGGLVKDDSNLPIFRDDYIIEGINCEPLSFNTECHRINEFYKKNNQREEVKSHSYIISFDPRDQIDNGLTMKDVQAFGKEFANKYLPGYQTIVCSHSDGSNGSGNLHCHIVINSIRIMDVEREPYMDQYMDNLAGGKHRCTPEFERFIKSKIMEMCQERGLYQVNLLEPASDRINDREYYMNLRGKQFEGENYQTRKEYIRCAVRDCAVKSNNQEEFKQIMLLEYGITIKESRGRFSFILPDRERGITERQMGTVYTKEFIGKVIRREEIYYDRNDFKPYRTNDYVSPSVKRLVDISVNDKAQQSKGYEHAVILSNLKKTTETINLLSEKSIKEMTDLENAISKISAIHASTSKELKSIEHRIAEVKTAIQLKEEIERIKPFVMKMKTGKQTKAYRQEHEGDLIIFKAAKIKLKQLPSELIEISTENLRKELQELTDRNNILYEQRSQMRKDLRDLENAQHNIRMISNKERIVQRDADISNPSL